MKNLSRPINVLLQVLSSMRHFPIVLVIIMAFSSCSDQEVGPALKELSFNEVTSQLPFRIVSFRYEPPTQEGALGRNRSGYFHISFQRDIEPNAVYAVYNRQERALTELAKSLDYSFNRQLSSGNFLVKVPFNLLNFVNQESPNLTTGTIHFGASLGMALHVLSQSNWYQQLDPNQADKKIISSYGSRIREMALWLKEKSGELQIIDSQAASNLFWSANCFYALGNYLQDDKLLQIGEEFLRRALAQQHSDGYFKEKGGFDTSCNGVSIRVGLQLYTFLSPGDLKKELGSALLRAARWQSARVLTSGEISIEGNTRVFPGGEKFLGQEMSVAWKDTVQAFFWLDILTGQPNEFSSIAEKIIIYYD